MKDKRYHLITANPDNKDKPDSVLIVVRYDSYNYLVKKVIRNDTHYFIDIDTFVNKFHNIDILFSDDSFDNVMEYAMMEIL